LQNGKLFKRCVENKKAIILDISTSSFHLLFLWDPVNYRSSTAALFFSVCHNTTISTDTSPQL